MPEDKRGFFVGETVIMTVYVYKPGTTTLIDADVVDLASFKLNGVEHAPPGSVFQRVSKGTYVITMLTEGWVPGVYKLVARAMKSGTPPAVVMIDDQFWLEAL